MHNPPFDFHARCSERDCATAALYIGSLYRPPDLIIAPAGVGEYLFRWYVVPRNHEGNVYFHVQTASDPERPLHDHPWDNTSVILAGGYMEIIDTEPEIDHPTRYTVRRRKGDVIHRPATWASGTRAGSPPSRRSRSRPRANHLGKEAWHEPQTSYLCRVQDRFLRV
jgi:hypothetical protein